MSITDLAPGAPVMWAHSPRGGYGYVWRIRATVERVGRVRVLIRAPLARGGEKLVWVSPQSLSARAEEG